jgi:hypothetical protein
MIDKREIDGIGWSAVKLMGSSSVLGKPIDLTGRLPARLSYEPLDSFEAFSRCCYSSAPCTASRRILTGCRALLIYFAG